ncbi:MAG: SRPBCC family protein [Acidimicrobiia bacterium]|nr:SRPBCC family protein [Acidimicrobiia bacterium]
MQLEHDFTIEQPISAVWEVLTNLRNVATALPGASIEDVEADGTHHGLLRLKLGSFSTQFRGIARYEEIDEVEHRVVLTGEGQSAHGRARLNLEGRADALGPQSTRVSLTSRVDLNGRIAQFGATMAGDVARQVLDRFVVNLTELFESDGSAEADRGATRSPSGIGEAEALDLGSVLVPPALRDPKVLLALVVAAALGWLLGRRGTRPTAIIDPSQWRP